MNDSHINVSNSATTFVGADAVNLFRAVTLVSALKLYAAHKMITTRGATPTVLLQLAGQYTGKKYKRGQHLVAAGDVQVWVDTMRAALPVTFSKEETK